MTIEAKLRISGDARGAVGAVKGVRSALDPLRAGIASVSQQLATVRQQFVQVFGAAVVAQGVRGLAQQADGYAALSARLRVATKDQAEYAVALRTTRSLAQQYNQPLRETGTLFTRALAALKPLGGGIGEATVATDALLASLKITGATSAESSSAILQFSQALGSGVLRGEEFNAINEAAPRLLDALAQGLGKPREQLKLLAEQGELTTARIIPALAKALPALRAQAAQIPTTIGGAVQQAQNELFVFFGQTAEGSKAVATLIGLIKTLGENVEPLVTAVAALGAVLIALKLGSVAAGLAATATAAAAAAGGIATWAGAGRAALAVFGGPIGVVATVLSLAAAWLLVGKAQEKGQRPADALEQQRKAVTEEIAKLEKISGRFDKKNAAAIAVVLNEQRAKLKLIDEEIEGQRELQRLEGRTGPGGAAVLTQLRDSSAIRRFEEENRTRADIARKFDDERKAYTIAKDREIQEARARGDEATARKLTAQRDAYLAEQAKAQADALRKFGAEETLTRIAQVRERFDAELELLRDRLAREAQANQEAFDAGLRDAASYLAERGRLEREQSDADIRALEQQVERRRSVLATNRQRLARPASANEREQLGEAVLQQEQDILQLETEIEKKRRDQVRAAAALRGEQERIAAELRQIVADVEARTAQLRGSESVADIQRRVQEQFRPLLEQVFQRGDVAAVEKLVDLTVLREVFAQAQRDFGEFAQALQIEERAIEAEAERGAIAVEEAERRKFAARDAALPQLQQTLALLERAAKTPAEQNAVEALKERVGELQQRGTKLEAFLRGNLGGGFAQLFEDIASGAKSAGEAFRSFLGGIVRSALNVIAQRLGERLASSLLPSSGGGGPLSGIATFLASFLHGGGIVGAGGMLRAVPAAAFAFAPRYHSGGIAGLRRNEVPAVLERGEEVLPSDHPRHARNARAVGDVSIAVSVNGAQGSATEQRGAGAELGRAIEAAIDGWAITNSRAGGILARR